ncbi:redox-regulated ATPase YchF [Candidatus Giovannonibacteria bacterium]|nr:redox-regulated ATPase YchF [Candidatus Giovannonibacteria bacterium]
MSLKIGIVGLPNVGKSTLFQALTKKAVDRSNYPFATIDPNIGVVAVPDGRLEKLAILSKSAKIIPAIVEFVDIAGLVKGAAAGEGLGNQFLTHIKNVDAIVEVVRVFKDASVTHVEGEPNPKRDIEIIEAELILKDLEVLEKALQKLGRESKSGDKKIAEKFEKLKTLISKLNGGSLEFSPEEKTLAGEYELLVSKPRLYCFNAKFAHEIPAGYEKNSVILDLKQEFEVSELSKEEKRELGVASDLGKLIVKAYEILNLISFFTTGEDETRAWTIPKGSKAPRAGRAIHGDFENKFIRAEVIGAEDLLASESIAKAREKGLMRIEGKDYVVKDGDVIEFRI